MACWHACMSLPGFSPIFFAGVRFWRFIPFELCAVAILRQYDRGGGKTNKLMTVYGRVFVVLDFAHSRLSSCIGRYRHSFALLLMRLTLRVKRLMECQPFFPLGF